MNIRKWRSIGAVGIAAACIAGIISAVPNQVSAVGTGGPPTPVDLTVPIQDVVRQAKSIFESGDLIGRIGQTIQTIGRERVIPLGTRGVTAVFVAVRDVVARVKELDFAGLARSIVKRVLALFH